MRDLRSYSDETWDRFFDFLYDNAEDAPIEEVQQHLREAGIDTRPAVEHLRRLINEKRQCHKKP